MQLLWPDIPGGNLASVAAGFGALGTDHVGADLAGFMGVLEDGSMALQSDFNRRDLHTFG